MPAPDTPPPRIVAAFPVHPLEVYREEYDYGTALAAGAEPELLVGLAIDETGGAHPIVMDDGSATVLIDEDVTTDLSRTAWYHQRNGRAAA